MGNDQQISVPFWIDFLGGVAERHANIFFRLASREESALLTDSKQQHPPVNPIYICGLARAGSSILLELLSSHPQLASHRYKDFPFLAIPLWWNWVYDRITTSEVATMERSHKDGIMVTQDSPEAMEEILWMHFFPNCHDPASNNVLDGSVDFPEFEQFYTQHQRKILLLRNGERYLAKGNYNVTRLEYILKILPEARFVLPVRDPVNHVASLMKQDALFRKEESRDKRLLAYMRRCGHFEFGLGRTALNMGNQQRTEQIKELWKQGQDVRAWAMYWADIYEYVAERLQANKALRKATTLVHFETFCQQPKTTLETIYKNCDLEIDSERLQEQADKISAPDYYKVPFSDQEKEIIKQETEQVLAKVKVFFP